MKAPKNKSQHRQAKHDVLGTPKLDLSSIFEISTDHSKGLPQATPKPTRKRPSRLAAHHELISTFVMGRAKAIEAKKSTSKFSLQCLANKLASSASVTANKSTLSRYISRNMTLRGLFNGH